MHSTASSHAPATPHDRRQTLPPTEVATSDLLKEDADLVFQIRSTAEANFPQKRLPKNDRLLLVRFRAAERDFNTKKRRQSDHLTPHGYVEIYA